MLESICRRLFIRHQSALEQFASHETRADDPDDMVDEVSLEEDNYGCAEGQSFIIQYRDSNGKISKRPITVWGIKPGADGCPVLVAQCHLRKKQRSFRVDRIEDVFDYDGVSLEPVHKFLMETFGIAVHLLQSRTVIPDAPHTPQNLAPRSISHVRAQLIILAALSLSDGQMRGEEVGVAIDYYCECLQRANMTTSAGDVDYMRKFIQNLAPDEYTFYRAVDIVKGAPAEEISALVIASRNLVHADHELHANELAMLNELSVELLGVPVGAV